MNRSCVQLKDLPDELLIFIFKQMNNIEVFYTLFGINERLDLILQDSIFTNRLNFLKRSSKKFLNIFSPDIIFDRFCLQILPAVREKIQWLDVESSSLKQILCAADYPNLYRLGLFNIEEETIKSLFTVKETFIDGHNLKNKIINHMSQLNKFTFNICSIMRINNQIILLSKEDIQNTFKDFQYTQMICYMDHFRKRKECQCHVYTYPSQMSYYQYLSNQFPGGYYSYVRFVSLYDEYPFEHEFFLQIAQSFLFIEKLVLINREPQQHKQSYKSMNDNCHLSIVEYSHLIELNIEQVHDDYVEEFLCDTKTCFRKNIRLDIVDKTLLRVTKHFTRKDTRRNCIKVNSLLPWSEWRSLKSFQEYFPSVRRTDYICSFFM
ncbi:unnamed protein product [Rotaria sp. Silwood1]|nr:unnamed protein product [Rotaria sp. Silwood1]CAF0964780.1 unnamed protein product [Rotaria sp. Silwood1]